MYCPKCKSLLYPIDTDYILQYGVCSYCVTFNKGKNATKGDPGNIGTTADMRNRLDSPVDKSIN
jgi:hypothetical protein